MSDNGTGDIPIVGTPASDVPPTPSRPDRSPPLRSADGGSLPDGAAGAGRISGGGHGGTDDRTFAIPTGFPSIPFGRRHHPGRRR